jgi:mycothiol synthase
MAEKQLRMIRRHLESLPEVEIPEAYGLRTYGRGDEKAWARIMNTGLGEWTAYRCRKKLTGQPQFLPEGLFFATYREVPVGSACAWRDSPDEWVTGILHMVCVRPEHRGKGLGHLVSLAVLRFLRDRGFREARLLTDDRRIPAIRSYLRLGFEPLYVEESHVDRWAAVMAGIDEE